MLLYWYLLHYGMLLHIMVQYVCLFSLIWQGLHEEGECRQLEFWTGKGQIWETYSAQLQKSWKFIENYSGIYKNYWAKKIPEGTHQVATSLGARPQGLWAPWQVTGAHLWLYGGFLPRKKIRRELLGWRATVSRRSLGGRNLGLRWSYSAGETSLREGEIKAIVITYGPLIEGGSS